MYPLPSPFVLATTQLNMGTLRSRLLPLAHSYAESSIWDFTSPTTPAFVKRSNCAFTVDIGNWVERHTADPWIGTQATAQSLTHRSPPYFAFLQLQLGQTVTLLS